VLEKVSRLQRDATAREERIYLSVSYEVHAPRLCMFDKKDFRLNCAFCAEDCFHGAN
jgi:hypothetical protein